MKVYVVINGCGDESIEKIFTDKKTAEEYTKLTSCELIEYDIDNKYTVYDLHEYEMHFNLINKKVRFELRNNCFDEMYFPEVKVGEPNLNISVFDCTYLAINIRIKTEHNSPMPDFNYVKELELLKEKYITAVASLYDENTIREMLNRSLKNDLKELFH